MNTVNVTDDILYLWRFDCRHLGIDGTSTRHPFILHSASKQRFSEKEAVAEIKQRFTPEWWAGNLITNVTYVGELNMIAGVPLYEKD